MPIHNSENDTAILSSLASEATSYRTFSDNQETQDDVEAMERAFQEIRVEYNQKPVDQEGYKEHMKVCLELINYNIILVILKLFHLT